MMLMNLSGSDVLHLLPMLQYILYSYLPSIFLQNYPSENIVYKYIFFALPIQMIQQ